MEPAGVEARGYCTTDGGAVQRDADARIYERDTCLRERLVDSILTRRIAVRQLINTHECKVNRMGFEELRELERTVHLDGVGRGCPPGETSTWRDSRRPC